MVTVTGISRQHTPLPLIASDNTAIVKSLKQSPRQNNTLLMSRLVAAMGSMSGDNTSEESGGVVMGDTGLQEEAARGSSPPERSTSVPTTTTTTYRVYRQRWMVLATVVLLNISNAGVSSECASRLSAAVSLYLFIVFVSGT